MGFLDSFLQFCSPVSLLGALLVVLLLHYLLPSCLRLQGRMKEPPGPTPLPLIGNLLQLDMKRPYNTFMELSKKYGSVFTVYLGPKRVVVLTGYKTVKEALVTFDQEFGDRDHVQILHELSQDHGILWSNGDSWREMRRFALTNLRDFGMGKKACEDKIIEESHYLIEALKSFKGQSFDTTQSITRSVANIICSIIFGRRFEYDDAEFKSLTDRLGDLNTMLGSSSLQLYNMMPLLFKWVPDRKKIWDLYASIKRQNWNLISNLKETLDPQNCRSFVDAFLSHKQNLEHSGVTNSHFHDQNLLITVNHVFAGATETTTTTLRWGLLLMAKYPNVQDQVREELERIVGQRQVQVADRNNLHFTNAVVHETQRVATIFPLSLPHKTSQSVTFHGHVIPKGTTVFPVLKSVLYDETQWERPDSFYPAHFLDKDGKFVKRDAFMPFSAGRRICPGESLARMELFIFLSSLLQHFRFTPPPGVSEDELSLTTEAGLAFTPTPHKLCAIPCH
ncbi:unnamed protein product [Ophioblennius macclurei]